MSMATVALSPPVYENHWNFPRCSSGEHGMRPYGSILIYLTVGSPVIPMRVLESDSNSTARSHGSGDCHNWNHGKNGEVPAESQVEAGLRRTRISNGEMQDSDSTLTNGSQLQLYNGPGSLDENFEYCVKIIRWLECDGHIKQEFKLKFLTWFSFRYAEQERRVVNTFIQTLIDDLSSLAGQLVDSFSEIVSSKTPRNGFCSELWH